MLTLANIAEHIDDSLFIFLEFDLLPSMLSHLKATLQSVRTCADIQVNFPSLVNIATVLDRLAVSGLQAAEAGAQISGDCMELIAEGITLLLAKATNLDGVVTTSAGVLGV